MRMRPARSKSETRLPASDERIVAVSDVTFPKSNDCSVSQGASIKTSRIILAPVVVGQTVSMPSSRYIMPRVGS